MKSLREMAYRVAELLACLTVIPIVLAVRGLRSAGRGRRSRATRVPELLRWYPAVWRERHGTEMGDLLVDAIVSGRDGVRLTLDVARAGIAERVRTRRASRALGGLTAGLGWTMIFAQGVAVTVLGSIDGLKPGWFVALHVTGPARWLVAGAMVAGGAALVSTSFALFGRDCAARAPLPEGLAGC